MGCMGVFICFIFMIQVTNLYKGGKIKQMEWDMATITAGDYTVEWEILEDTYRQWYDNVYMADDGDYSKGIAPGLSMKQHLKEKIEEDLTRDLRA